jgi:hypothetical protein
MTEKNYRSEKATLDAGDGRCFVCPHCSASHTIELPASDPGTGEWTIDCEKCDS